MHMEQPCFGTATGR